MVEHGEDVTDEDQDLWYLRRLDGGLFTLQTVDYILGWIVMEDDGVSYALLHSKALELTNHQIRAHALQMLNRKDQNLKNIVETLRIYHDNVGEQDAQDNDELTQKHILGGLIDALDS
jgi:beta-catenin-like protein 1